MQSIPSIESVGDSDSDDEDEDIIFSGLHNSHQEVRVCILNLLDPSTVQSAVL